MNMCSFGVLDNTGRWALTQPQLQCSVPFAQVQWLEFVGNITQSTCRCSGMLKRRSRRGSLVVPISVEILGVVNTYEQIEG